MSFLAFARKIVDPVSRLALFIIYFWFGLLKVLGLSPASSMIRHLFDQTISFMDFGTFYICFAIFECIIGILFLIKGWEKLALSLLFIHLFIVSGPLIFLPQEIWQSFLVPTLEGQYIIKNLALIAVGIGIASRLGTQRYETV
jgi:uncharacterized membrane protein YkgB